MDEPIIENLNESTELKLEKYAEATLTYFHSIGLAKNIRQEDILKRSFIGSDTTAKITIYNNEAAIIFSNHTIYNPETLYEEFSHLILQMINPSLDEYLLARRPEDPKYDNKNLGALGFDEVMKAFQVRNYIEIFAMCAANLLLVENGHLEQVNKNRRSFNYHYRPERIQMWSPFTMSYTHAKIAAFLLIANYEGWDSTPTYRRDRKNFFIESSKLTIDELGDTFYTILNEYSLLYKDHIVEVKKDLLLATNRILEDPRYNPKLREEN